MARRRWGGWVSVRMLRALGQVVRVHAAAGARTVAPPVFSAFAVAGWCLWRRRVSRAGLLAAFFPPRYYTRNDHVILSRLRTPPSRHDELTR